MSATAVPQFGAQASNELDSVSLTALRPGRVVEFTTQSGSTYWVSSVVGHSAVAGCIKGVTITSNSASFGRLTQSPLEVEADAVIRVGRVWRFASGGRTNTVRSIRLL